MLTMQSTGSSNSTYIPPSLRFLLCQYEITSSAALQHILQQHHYLQHTHTQLSVPGCCHCFETSLKGGILPFIQCVHVVGCRCLCCVQYFIQYELFFFATVMFSSVFLQKNIAGFTQIKTPNSTQNPSVAFSPLFTFFPIVPLCLCCSCH